jgi:hypothetical protein
MDHQNRIRTETRASPSGGTKKVVSAREQVLTPPENVSDVERVGAFDDGPNMMAEGFWDIDNIKE